MFRSLSHSHGHGNHQHTEGAHHDHAHAAHGHSDDHWDGEAYLSRPGIKETAAINAENVATALKAAGYSPESFSKLEVLEVGCGPGLVTEHLAKTFGSVHAIETSASQLKTFAAQPVAKETNVTWGLVTIRPGVDMSNAVPSPTPEDGNRQKSAPRDKFDVAVANLVVHHVDDISRFLGGILSVLKPGGIVVITEFTLAENGRDVVAEYRAKVGSQIQKEAEKVRYWLREVLTFQDVGNSVNAPNHLHHTFTVESLSKQLDVAGFVDIAGARCKPVPVFPDAAPVPLLYIYGFKSNYEGGASLQREASHRENRTY